MAKKLQTSLAVAIGLIAAAFVVTIASCGDSSKSNVAVSVDAISVVTTSNIVGEWVGIVGGDRVEVTSLVPRQADPHSYEPGARDIALVAEADTIFTVGRGLEDVWLADLLENASAHAAHTVKLAELVDALPFVDTDDHEDVNHDEHAGFDPHFWFDPNRVKQAVREIAHTLGEIDPQSAALFESNVEAYEAQLDELDAWIEDQVALINAHDRVMMTSHDSLEYFATRYGFEVVGVIIPGGGTEIEPTPAEFANLSERVSEHGVKAVFAEVQLSDRLAQTLAREAGVQVVGGLHTGSLAREGTVAGTYIGLMRHNVEIIVNTLK